MRTVQEARRLSLPAAAFTFFSEGNGLKGEKRIYPTREKLSLISECGIDEVIIANFEDVRSISAEDFIEKTLVGDLGCALALSGKDFRFGMGAKGDAELLGRMLRKHGSDLISHDFVRADGEKISSSRIKELLLCGDVKRAAELLGEPYMQKSEVKRGLGLAHSFGFPTVNIAGCEHCISLPSGVYKCLATY